MIKMSEYLLMSSEKSKGKQVFIPQTDICSCFKHKLILFVQFIKHFTFAMNAFIHIYAYLVI